METETITPSSEMLIVDSLCGGSEELKPNLCGSPGNTAVMVLSTGVGAGNGDAEDGPPLPRSATAPTAAAPPPRRRGTVFDPPFFVP